jgi:integrase
MHYNLHHKMQIFARQTAMKHFSPGPRFLKDRGGWWHYVRRVSQRFQDVDKYGLTQLALCSLSLEIAMMRRNGLAEADDALWSSLALLAEGFDLSIAVEELHLELHMIIYRQVQTGMRLSEIINLRPDDIRLSHEVPHIIIRPEQNRELKSSDSQRESPFSYCEIRFPCAWSFACVLIVVDRE